MPQNYEAALAYSQKWLSLIKKDNLSREEAEMVIKESTKNFADHFNAGWLQYRKSVALEGEWAAVEWKGQGSVFTDVLNREFIDCLGGYGLLNLGWSHPEVIEAVQDQLRHSPMPSQELIDPLRGVLAHLVSLITPGNLNNSFFCASGTEAIEGAVKLAKMYTKKSAFIAATNAFHGKTMASLSLMGKKDYRAPVGQLYGGEVFHVPFGDAGAMQKQLEICDKIGIGVAAVILEPVQGEAGGIVPPDDYWPAVRAMTKAHGCLLIADEVQTGMGRTGELFAVNHWGVVPDILCMAKSFGGGVMPVSCFCSTAEIWKVMEEPNPFIHTTTTGGGALACAAAIAGIKVVLRDRLWEVARARGDYWMPKLKALAEKYKGLMKMVTGKGLLIGLHFHSTDDGYAVAAELFKRRVLVAGTLIAASTLRLEPPLQISTAQIDQVTQHLADSLEVVAQRKASAKL